MDTPTFLNNKMEIMYAVKKSDQETELIDAKPKYVRKSIDEETYRGSKYRGVSKNKGKWQMMIMLNQRKVYMGSIDSEVQAARLYDHVAILSKGLNAKTNYTYTAAQLKKIVKDYDFTNDKNYCNDHKIQIPTGQDCKD